MKFTCEMNDGSVFTMPNEAWQKAYDMKYKKDNQKEIKAIFRKLTEKHWTEKTSPTKYGHDEKWGQGESKKKYKNQAELGEEVMYQYIRTALMGIVFSEMTGGKGKVIGIRDDGKTETYPKKEAKK